MVVTKKKKKKNSGRDVGYTAANETAKSPKDSQPFHNLQNFICYLDTDVSTLISICYIV